MIRKIEVVGLREVSRKLRAVDKDAPKALSAANKSAAEFVQTRVKAKVPHGPAKRGHAVNSIRAGATRLQAYVKGGGARYPYYPWLEFGGRVGRKNSVYRTFIKTGRYLWRTFVDHRNKIRDFYADELNDLLRRTGLI